MALDKVNLKINLKVVMFDMMERENVSINEFVNRLVDHVDDYVKSADIVYTNGLTSATGGLVTGTFNGSLQ